MYVYLIFLWASLPDTNKWMDGWYVNLYSAPSYEPLKHSGMDHTVVTL